MFTGKVSRLCAASTPSDLRRRHEDHGLPTFDMAALVKTPLEATLLPKPEMPPFVCQRDWLLNVQDTIKTELDNEDKLDGSNRVRPMAFMRCSRGGKTRALFEIAHSLRK